MPRPQEQGYPWIVRKTIVRFGSAAATDIIWQSGTTLRVVSVNAKGAWQRKTIIGKEVRAGSGTGAPERSGLPGMGGRGPCNTLI